ncbi:MAG: hypothetical protein IMF01_09485 [Proteobacteria bacterium]|nr:hypothetical protein [Pseudomonadota bacterium]
MSKVIAIACDTEFTSFDKIGGDLLSAAFVEILDDYTLGRDACFYSRPRGTKYFTENAQKIHGISYFKAIEFPEPRDACLSILQWYKPLIDKFPIDFVNHANGALDLKWVDQLMRNNDLIDSWQQVHNGAEVINTIKMAKTYLDFLKPSKTINPVSHKPYGKHSLINIADYYDIDLTHHDALSDAKACAIIYCNMKREHKTFTGELF